jgi:hypothetical protein
MPAIGQFRCRLQPHLLVLSSFGMLNRILQPVPGVPSLASTFDSKPDPQKVVYFGEIAS